MSLEDRYRESYRTRILGDQKYDEDGDDAAWVEATLKAYRLGPPLSWLLDPSNDYQMERIEKEVNVALGYVPSFDPDALDTEEDEDDDDDPI